MKGKKVLFVIPSFGMGGTLSSLKALLSLIDYEFVKIDVFSLYKVGPNSESIPNAQILKESVWLSSSIKENRGLKRYFQILLRAIKHFLAIIHIDVLPFYIWMGAKDLHLEQYDCVVSYSEGLTRFVSLFPIKHKIAWTHSVYSRYKELIGGKDELYYYKRFDYIVCVSEYAKADFVSVYESLRDRVRVIYNCCDERRLLELSRAFFPAEYINNGILHQLTITSIGRLDPVKQFSLIPQIASVIKRNVGSCFKWYIIGGKCGDGNEAIAISTKIEEYNVADVVQLIGERSNPYPYIANSDVLVHTSSSETFGMVVQEALVLGVPAILNNYGSANETVIDGINGVIVHLDHIAEIIIKLISDRSYLQNLRKQTARIEQKRSILHTEAPVIFKDLLFQMR